MYIYTNKGKGKGIRLFCCGEVGVWLFGRMLGSGEEA